MPEIGEDGRVANAAPILPAPTAAQQQKLHELESAIAALEQSIESREKTWTWRKGKASQALRLAAGARVTDGAVLQISCDAPKEFKETPTSGFQRVPGVVGQACVTAEALPKPETAGVPIDPAGAVQFQLLAATRRGRYGCGAAFGDGLFAEPRIHHLR